MATVIFRRAFWVTAGERAIRTAAQSMILAVGQDVTAFDLFEADVWNVLGLGAGGALLSVLTTVAFPPDPSVAVAVVAQSTTNEESS